MATLRVLSEQPDRIVFGRGGISSAGNLVGLAIFGVATCIGLTTAFGDPRNLNPVVVVVALVVGLVLLTSALNAIRSTRVILDAGQRVAVRIESLLVVPLQRREMALNVVREIQVVPMRGLARQAPGDLPVWQAQLQGTDGSALVFNERGTRSEMQALAQRVGSLLNLPVRNPVETKSASTPPASVFPAGSTPGMTSLLSSLATFGQAYSGADSAATDSTPVPNPRANRAARARSDQPASRSARRAAPTPPASAPQANTLLPTTMFVNQEAPSTPTDYPGTDQPAPAPVAEMGTPDLAYGSPPVLIMPELPGFSSFSPALNLPSIPPIGTPLTIQSTPIPDAQDLKEVPAQVTPGPGSSSSSEQGDALSQYRAGRQLYAAHRLGEAQAAYLRALAMNPAEPAVQNDLGVVYLEQNKMREAEGAFRRSVALDPFGVPGRYNLGMLLMRLNRRKEAIEQFKTGAHYASAQESSALDNALQGNLTAPMLSRNP
jgi:hypothetical protein